MSGQTWGDVGRLRETSAWLVSRTAASRGPVADYDVAIASLNAALEGSDLPAHFTSYAGELDALLDRLQVDDQMLGAYADALEWADSNLAGFHDLPAPLRDDLLSRFAQAVHDGGRLGEEAREAAARGVARYAADQTLSLMRDDEASLAAWQDLAQTLEPWADNEVFAVGLADALGSQAFAELPQQVAVAWQRSAASGDGWDDRDQAPAWQALETFSRTLATASHTIAEPGGLDAGFVTALLDARNQGPRYAEFSPAPGEVGLLFSAGGFSDEALTPVAAFAEEHLSQWAGLGRVGVMDPWGVFSDPAMTTLPAIAESPVAAGSQPRVLAQLTSLGELTGDDLDLAYHEAARVGGQDPAFRATLLDELEATRLVAEEERDDLALWLIATGRATAAVSDAAQDTVEALRAHRSRMGRQLAKGNYNPAWARANPEALSQAGRSLRRTPGWLSQVAGNKWFRRAGGCCCR